jgi:hypothetical protein
MNNVMLRGTRRVKKYLTSHISLFFSKRLSLFLSSFRNCKPLGLQTTPSFGSTQSVQDNGSAHMMHRNASQHDHRVGSSRTRQRHSQNAYLSNAYLTHDSMSVWKAHNNGRNQLPVAVFMLPFLASGFGIHGHARAHNFNRRASVSSAGPTCVAPTKRRSKICLLQTYGCSS